MRRSDALIARNRGSLSQEEGFEENGSGGCPVT